MASLMIPNNIWEFIKSWEGGDTLTDDADDTGGLTRWGISQANNPGVDVRNLTESEAQKIYFDKYFIGSNTDELPAFMQLVHFNCAVNCGPITAVKILQRVVGASVDGIAGPQTIGKAHHYFKGPRFFVTWYLTHQALYYFNIVERRRSQHKWLKGWIRRTIDAAWITAVDHG